MKVRTKHLQLDGEIQIDLLAVIIGDTVVILFSTRGEAALGAASVLTWAESVKRCETKRNPERSSGRIEKGEWGGNRTEQEAETAKSMKVSPQQQQRHY